MTELTQILKDLISLPGLSGNETPVREVITEIWRPYVDEFSVSRLGSLHGLKKGSGVEPRPRLLLAAHMDAIGLMVTTLEQGLIHFTRIGGVDHRILPGQLVTVHGRQELKGVVVQPADRLLPSSAAGKPVKMDYLFVDVGLSQAEVEKLVRTGDLISFAQQPLELSGETLSGHSLDNRASIAALTYALQELSHMQPAWDTYFVATVQEEETLAGGLTSPFEIRPDMAIAVDVTHAKGPGVNDYRGFGLGKGPVLGMGPNIHPAIFAAFKSLSERLDIPTQIEVMPSHSGTDAYAIQIVGEGIPSMVVSIPLRYMHTPVELVSIKDIQRTGRLLAEFIARLEPDFISKIRWDDKTDD